MPRLLLDKTIKNLNLDLGLVDNLVCSPNDEFYKIKNEIMNNYNTIVFILFSILIMCIVICLTIFRLINKKVIEYHEDQYKTVISINHMV